MGNSSCPSASGTAGCVSLRFPGGGLKARVTNLLAITVRVVSEIVAVLAYEKDIFSVKYAKSEIRELFGCSQDSRDTR